MRVNDEAEVFLFREAEEDVQQAFADATAEQIRQLCEGLAPFRREGNWIDTLCIRLENMLGNAGMEDWSLWSPDDIFLEGWYGNTALR